jgi:hypothetical protein
VQPSSVQSASVGRRQNWLVWLFGGLVTAYPAWRPWGPGRVSCGGDSHPWRNRGPERLMRVNSAAAGPPTFQDFKGISKAWSAFPTSKKPRSCLPREAASFIRLAALRASGLGPQRGLGAGMIPEKWAPVFREDHAS